MFVQQLIGTNFEDGIGTFFEEEVSAVGFKFRGRELISTTDLNYVFLLKKNNKSLSLRNRFSLGGFILDHW